MLQKISILNNAVLLKILFIKYISWIFIIVSTNTSSGKIFFNTDNIKSDYQ